jgi:hypothetical protein
MPRVLDYPVSSASPELNGMVEADAVSGVAKGDGNEERRGVMKTIVQV